LGGIEKREMMGTTKHKPQAIEARSIVSGRDLEPYIQIVLVYDDGSEDQVTQWTPQEAYNHAIAVLGAVEAANTDAFLVAFLTEKIGVQVENTVAVLRDFREWRERRRTPENAI
jgi:hypothetical protein